MLEKPPMFAPIEHLHQNVIVFVQQYARRYLFPILLRHVARLALSLAALNTEVDCGENRNDGYHHQQLDRVNFRPVTSHVHLSRRLVQPRDLPRSFCPATSVTRIHGRVLHPRTCDLYGEHSIAIYHGIAALSIGFSRDSEKFFHDSIITNTFPWCIGNSLDRLKYETIGCPETHQSLSNLSRIRFCRWTQGQGVDATTAVNHQRVLGFLHGRRS